jgi:hypothetical protein
VYRASDYNNGVKKKSFNESFILYEYDEDSGLIKIKLNSLLSTALTGQFTLINIDHKKDYVKNEKYLAIYDFIAGKVNKGETKGFTLDTVIKTLESIEGDISKFLRSKYRKILISLSESKVLGEIEVGNRGENTCFIVSR